MDLKLNELAEANVGLYESNRFKSEFLANVSHELRTPLNSIIGFAELLEEMARGDGTGTENDPKRMRYIANILTSGRSLLEMINELLDMAKIEAGRMEVNIEPTSVGDLIEGLVGIMRPQAEAKKIELKTEIAQRLPVVETDPGKLQQIIYNFLSNAIKFTPSGGSVTISADRITRQDNSTAVRLGVADTGPGIPYDMQDVIFEKFRQIDASHTREHAGTGLGLAICKELAQMLNAQVSFVSAPGKGATFYVDLPLTHQPQAPQSLMAGV
jgi:signal transduction histidine kinase